MVTAVDSSVLIDVLANDPTYGASSLAALRDAAANGPILACAVVWSEVRAVFPDPEPMAQALANAGIIFDPIDRPVADLAGEMWRAYRLNGGSRERVLADFLIGSHARVRGGRLLTRDRGFYRRYVDGLDLIEN